MLESCRLGRSVKTKSSSKWGEGTEKKEKDLRRRDGDSGTVMTWNEGWTAPARGAIGRVTREEAGPSCRHPSAQRQGRGEMLSPCTQEGDRGEGRRAHPVLVADDPSAAFLLALSLRARLELPVDLVLTDSERPKDLLELDRKKDGRLG